MAKLSPKKIKRRNQLSEEAEPMSRAPASPPFYLLYNPNKWTVLEGQLVPQLERLAVEPGLNNVDRRGNADQAVMLKQRAGRILVRPEWAPDGDDYCTAWDGEMNGRRYLVHTTVWEACHPGSDRITQRDPQGYVTWVRGLVDSGRLPDIADHQLEVMLDKTRTRHAEAQDRAQQWPSYVTAVEEQARVLAVLEAAHAGREGSLQPMASKPARRRATAE